MNGAYLHLLFNHAPIIGSMVGLAIFLAGYLFAEPKFRKAALLIFVGSAVVSLPAYFSGEEAEDIVKTINGISKKVIHEHEEWGEKFIILTSVLGIAALLTLIADIKQLAWSRIGYMATLLIAVVTVAVSVPTGHSGGAIHHPEIQNNGAVTSPENQPQTPDSPKENDKDKDHD